MAKKTKTPKKIKLDGMHSLTEGERELVLMVPDNLLYAFACFWLRWRKVPVLVRAATAATVALHIATRSVQATHEASTLQKIGLLRRSLVDQHFATASDELVKLFVHLAREADDKAEVLGIDQHLEGEKE